MDSRYWDIENCLLGPHPENSILFTSEYWHLLALFRKNKQFSIKERSQIVKAINSQLLPDQSGFVSFDHNEPWSHDNHTGLICLSKLLDLPYHKKLTWKGWWRRCHPKDLIFYAYLRGGLPRLIVTPFLFILCFFMILTCHEKYKVRNGVKILKTDGKLLTFLRLQALPDLHLTKKICDEIIIERFGSWAGVFKTYFVEENHPNVILARAIFEGEHYENTK